MAELASGASRNGAEPTVHLTPAHLRTLRLDLAVHTQGLVTGQREEGSAHAAALTHLYLGVLAEAERAAPGTVRADQATLRLMAADVGSLAVRSDSGPTLSYDPGAGTADFLARAVAAHPTQTPVGAASFQYRLGLQLLRHLDDAVARAGGHLAVGGEAANRLDKLLAGHAESAGEAAAARREALRGSVLDGGGDPHRVRTALLTAGQVAEVGLAAAPVLDAAQVEQALFALDPTYQGFTAIGRWRQDAVAAITVDRTMVFVLRGGADASPHRVTVLQVARAAEDPLLGTEVVGREITLDPTHRYGPLRRLAAPAEPGRFLGVEVGIDYRGNLLIGAPGPGVAVRTAKRALRRDPAGVLSRREVFGLQVGRLGPVLEIASRMASASWARQLRDGLQAAVAATRSTGAFERLTLRTTYVYIDPIGPDDSAAAAAADHFLRAVSRGNHGLRSVLADVRSHLGGRSGGPRAGRVPLDAEVPGVMLWMQYAWDGSRLSIQPELTVDPTVSVSSRPSPTPRQAQIRQPALPCPDTTVVKNRPPRLQVEGVSRPAEVVTRR